MKNKKTVCFISITLLLSFFMTMVPFGCSNSGFKMVSSIEYTTNGTTMTRVTSCRTHYGAGIYITEQEYEAAPTYKRIQDKYTFNGPSLTSVAETAKGKPYVEVRATKKQEEDDLYRYYKKFNSDLGDFQYYKAPEMYHAYYFIYVKVVDSATIIIRDHKGDTTYTVTSHRIKYFD